LASVHPISWAISWARAACQVHPHRRAPGGGDPLDRPGHPFGQLGTLERGVGIGPRGGEDRHRTLVLDGVVAIGLAGATAPQDIQRGRRGGAIYV